MADAHEHPVQVEALVQRLRRAGERRLLRHVHRLALGELQLRKGGGRRRGEGAAQLELLLREAARLVLRQHQHVAYGRSGLHTQQQVRAHGTLGVTQRIRQHPGVVPVEHQDRDSVVHHAGQRRQRGQRERTVLEARGGARGQLLQPVLSRRHGQQPRTGDGEQVPGLAYKPFPDDVRARALGGRGEHPADRPQRVPGSEHGALDRLRIRSGVYGGRVSLPHAMDIGGHFLILYPRPGTG